MKEEFGISLRAHPEVEEMLLSRFREENSVEEIWAEVAEKARRSVRIAELIIARKKEVADKLTPVPIEGETIGGNTRAKMPDVKAPLAGKLKRK